MDSDSSFSDISGQHVSGDMGVYQRYVGHEAELRQDISSQESMDISDLSDVPPAPQGEVETSGMEDEGEIEADDDRGLARIGRGQDNIGGREGGYNGCKGRVGRGRGRGSKEGPTGSGVGRGRGIGSEGQVRLVGRGRGRGSVRDNEEDLRRSLRVRVGRGVTGRGVDNEVGGVGRVVQEGRGSRGGRGDNNGTQRNRDDQEASSGVGQGSKSVRGSRDGRGSRGRGATGRRGRGDSDEEASDGDDRGGRGGRGSRGGPGSRGRGAKGRGGGRDGRGRGGDNGEGSRDEGASIGGDRGGRGGRESRGGPGSRGRGATGRGGRGRGGGDNGEGSRDEGANVGGARRGRGGRGRRGRGAAGGGTRHDEEVARVEALRQDRRERLKDKVRDMSRDELEALVIRSVEREPGLIIDLMAQDEAAPPSPAENRDIPPWCVCTNCSIKPLDVENLCCGCTPDECLTRHGTFALIIDEASLSLQRAMWNDAFNLVERAEQPGQAQKSMRHAAYRSVIFWQHGTLGKNNRRVVPSCCSDKIHERYPSPNNYYTGFKAGRFV